MKLLQGVYLGGWLISIVLSTNEMLDTPSSAVRFNATLSSTTGETTYSITFTKESSATFQVSLTVDKASTVYSVTQVTMVNCHQKSLSSSIAGDMLIVELINGHSFSIRDINGGEIFIGNLTDRSSSCTEFVGNVTSFDYVGFQTVALEKLCLFGNNQNLKKNNVTLTNGQAKEFECADGFEKDGESSITLTCNANSLITGGTCEKSKYSKFHGSTSISVPVDVKFGAGEMFLIETMDPANGTIKLMFSGAGYLVLDLKNKQYQLESCVTAKTNISGTSELDPVEMQIHIDFRPGSWLDVFFDNYTKIHKNFAKISESCHAKWSSSSNIVTIDGTTDIDLKYMALPYKGCTANELHGEVEVTPNKDLFYPGESALMTCTEGCTPTGSSSTCMNKTTTICRAGTGGLWTQNVTCNTATITSASILLLIFSFVVTY